MSDAPVQAQEGNKEASNVYAIRLGEILVEEQAISQEQFEEAIAKQAKTGDFIGHILVDLGFIGDKELTSFLAKYCKIPYLSLLDYLVDSALLEYLPAEVCLKYSLLPIDKLGRNLTVAMVNPLNTEALDEVKRLCEGLNIKPILCEWQHFKNMAEKLFDTSPEGEDGGAAMTSEDFGFTVPAEKKKQAEPAEDAASDSTKLDETPPSDSQIIRGTDKMKKMVEFMQASMNDTYEILTRRVALFTGLEPEFVATIFASGMTKEVEAGTAIFQKGDAGKELYAIMSGKVSISDGEKEIAVLEAGSMLGEMALLSDEPRSASATASETTSLFVLTDETFQKLLTKKVGVRIMLNMLATLSDRLRAANEKIAALEK